MKIKNLNFNITWESKRKIFIENLDESSFQFPTYNVIIKNEEDLLINKFNNLSNYIPKIEKIWNSQDTGYLCPHLEVRTSNSIASTEEFVINEFLMPCNSVGVKSLLRCVSFNKVI